MPRIGRIAATCSPPSGSGHNELGLYTEDSAEYQQVVDRLAKKWRTAAQLVPKPIIRRAAKAAKWGLIGIGSSDAAIREALDRLAVNGIHLDRSEERRVGKECR